MAVADREVSMFTDKYHWAKLTHLQVGRYAEYAVKMELVRAGLDVFTAEVDDKGIDFVIRRDSSTYFDIQVKSVRGFNYVFLQKDKFALRDNMFAAVVAFFDGKPPSMYLIPATAWSVPSALLVDREYAGKASKPEWGINLSAKNLPLFEPFGFDVGVRSLLGDDDDPPRGPIP